MRTSEHTTGYVAATPTVPAENFMATLAANVDNASLSADDFRDFVRNSMPVVIYPRVGEPKPRT